MSYIIGDDLNKCVSLLESGQLIGMPTETVYGLAANALDKEAVSAIFEVKKRPSFDPLIIHTYHFNAIRHLLLDFDPLNELLAASFWPGPMTILLPASEKIPLITRAGLPRVGVRVPKHPVALSLLRALSFPLAAPSANPFGFVSPSKAQHVADQLGDDIPYILEGGTCEIGLESSVLAVEEGAIIVYRKGGLTVESLKQFGAPVILKTHSSSNPASPGQLSSHYSPGVKMILGDIEQLLKVDRKGEKIGLLSFKKDYKKEHEEEVQYQWILSKEGSLEVAAKQLFIVLREIAKSDLTLLLAENVPDEGLGMAINDRLKRAAAQIVE